MKIAYVVSRYPAVSHSFIVREVRALRESGVDVCTCTVRRIAAEELLTEEDCEEDARTIAILPTTLKRIVQLHVAMVLRSGIRYLGAFRRSTRRRLACRFRARHLYYFAEAGILAGELHGRGIRHVHAHFANVASDVAMLAAHMLGITWSMTLHGTADFGDPSSIDLPEKVRSAEAVFCVSEAGRAQAMLYSDPDAWEKIHVVHCGLDPRVFAPSRNGGGSRGTSHVRLLCVGRLHPEKGQIILLEALRLARDRGVTANCVFVGEGKERPRLTAAAERLGLGNEVTFEGAVGQDKLQNYYGRCDVVVLPSLAEGLPVVLMEAMANEIPVIATRIMGVAELVDDGVSGILVSPGRASPLADAIVRLAADPKLRAKMGPQGRIKVRREFNIHTAASQLLQHFREASLRAPKPMESSPWSCTGTAKG